MIRCFVRFLSRFVRDPSYVINALRYVQYAVSEKIRRRGPISDVRVPRAKPFKSLLIVLRTSDTVQHCTPGERRLEEYGINDKHDVVMRCGASFVEAVRIFRERKSDVKLRIVLVEDRLSEEGKELYRKASPIEEVQSPPGNRETFLTQVEIAAKADDETLVCILEDDYFLDSNVFCEAFELFNSTSITGFTPNFHPDLVRTGTKVRLLYLNEKFYAHVPSTTCTFFISATDIRRNLSCLRRFYGCEIGCINEIWRRSVCVAPCCRTLAEHMHLFDLSYVWRG